MRKFGITREEAGKGSPDLAWLLAGHRGEAHLYAAGDRPRGLPDRPASPLPIVLEHPGGHHHVGKVPSPVMGVTLTGYTDTSGPHPDHATILVDRDRGGRAGESET